MEDRIGLVSRWFVALTVVFIPLSILVLISGSWGANFLSSQWTRYLLFASWVALTVSLVVGAGNTVVFMAEDKEEDEKSPRVVARGEDPEGEKEGGEETPAPSASRGKSSNMSYNLLLVQVATFLVGVVLYVAFISWMLLPKIVMNAY
ncbi:MAG: hypothetical protein HPY75_01050 [Actinobacteria bacterium]|nr:hypothetical protein [Actinomycetota bacterium]